MLITKRLTCAIAALATIALVSVAEAAADIRPGEPAGSCCRIGGVEGASQWSTQAQAWTCKLNALPINPHNTKITPQASKAWWSTHERSVWDKRASNQPAKTDSKKAKTDSKKAETDTNRPRN